MRSKKLGAAQPVELSRWQQKRLTRQQRLIRATLAPASAELVKVRPEDARWYCLLVDDGRESALGQRLADGGVETLVPTETIQRVIRGKAVDVERALFAGYAFIRIVPSFEAFAQLRKVKGVIDFLRFGERYHVIREADLGFYATDSSRLPKDKTIGDGSKIAIIRGPFCGLSGVVVQVSKPKSRDPHCRIWLDDFRREIKNIPLAFLKKL